MRLWCVVRRAYGNPGQPVAVAGGHRAAAGRAGTVWAALVAAAVMAGVVDVRRRLAQGLAGAAAGRVGAGAAVDRHGRAGVVAAGRPAAAVGFYDRGQLLVATRRRQPVRRFGTAVRLGPGSDSLGAAGDQPRSTGRDRSGPRASLGI